MNTTAAMPNRTGPQWLRAGWLFDGSGQPAQRDCWLALHDGRIMAIQSVEPAPLPVFHDFTEDTVLPPLTDLHLHLAFPDVGSGAGLTAAILERLRQLRRAGVLTVRDAGDCAGTALAFKGRLNPEPRAAVEIAAAGWGWHAPGRYGRRIAQAVPADRRLAQCVQRQPAADHIKIIQSGINSLEHFGRDSRPQFSEEELREAVRQAHAAGRPVMAHANGQQAVAAAINAGCDSIEHGYFMGRTNLARMGERGTIWVPTVVPMATLAQSSLLSPAQRAVAARTRDHQLEQIRSARSLGVAIGAGTDAGSPGVVHGLSLWQELALLSQAGLSVAEAVACAVAQAARLLKREGRGLLAAGAAAELIVVAGSPARWLQNPMLRAAYQHGGWWFNGKAL